MHYLDTLNEPQREAVLNTEGPLMIIAGAGSGKTRVLTYRIAYLLREKRVDPFSILSLTFTNKAAKEMRQRIEKEVGPDARNLWMGTFHSVFARILRYESDKIGYPSNFTIYDTDDSKALIKDIVKEMNLDEKVYKPNAILSRISSAKNRLVGALQYLNDPIIQADDAGAMRPHTGKIYKKYADRCFKSGAMDFDDLLFNTNVLFKEHPDVLNRYQDRFKYVMVDEFQDTNLSQYLITRRLAARHQNICVVGDDAQSIYAFRGADIQNILNFEKDYPDLKIVRLEQNYRSTKNIVEAANSIIQKNTAQLRKNVWTANEEGNLIEVVKAASDNEEGKLIASAIFEQKMQEQMSYSDFVILYRTNSQSRAMEEALRRMNIRYKIVGGLSFYQRKEIKDLLAYLRFTINHNDEQAMKRIINYPRRGIGETTVAKIAVAADEANVALWDVITNFTKFAGGRVGETVQTFGTLIKSFELITKTKDAFDAASHIAKTSGILKELYDDKTIEGRVRYENVQELLNAIKEFVDRPDNPDKSLGAFLQEIALLTDIEDKENENEESVTMMTIHSSKGLEFKSVFIVGLEEDLFPSQMMLASRADLEEERRLFYVAITRAEKKLTVSYATSRYRFGQLKSCEPSRFLNEIDQSYLRMNRKFSIPAAGEESFSPLVRKSAPAPGNNFVRKTVTSTTAIPSRSSAPATVVHKIHKPSDNFSASDLNTLEKGMRVEHQKFGMGIVVDLDMKGSDKKAKIRFEQSGEKTLLLSFAKLMIHS